MKDDQAVLLVECINKNPDMNPTQKLELIGQTLRDCQQKKIGKIVMDAIQKKSDNTPKKKRGRPRKENIRTENQTRMIKIAQENQSL